MVLGDIQMFLYSKHVEDLPEQDTNQLVDFNIKVESNVFLKIGDGQTGPVPEMNQMKGFETAMEIYMVRGEGTARKFLSGKDVWLWKMK